MLGGRSAAEGRKMRRSFFIFQPFFFFTIELAFFFVFIFPSCAHLFLSSFFLRVFFV